MADLVAVMDQGRIEQLGTPEEVFERPATRFVATFVGRTARIVGRVEAPGRLRTTDGIALRAGATPPSGMVEAFVRPHRVRLLRDGKAPGFDNALPGRVARRTYTGDVVSLEAETPAGPIAAEMHAGGAADWHALAPGDAVTVAFRADDLRVFPAP
jgi:putative spermidine/putrescine transport system ATP-binding protein